MSEWSKEVDLRSIAAMRVGSNPTPSTIIRGCSSNGRASALHAEGTGIDTPQLHYFFFEA